MENAAPIDSGRVRPVPYPDEELKPFFDYIYNGCTYTEATRRAGMNLERIQTTMDDIEVRQHILNLSMTLNAYKARHRRKFIKLVYVNMEYDYSNTIRKN